MGDTQDIVLAPLFLIIFVTLGFLLREKYTRSKPWIRKYFMPALVLRLSACILSIWMYDFYYDGGDMTVYFHASSAFANSFLENPHHFFEILFQSASQISDEAQLAFKENDTIQYFRSDSTLLMVKIGGLLYILSLGSIYGIGFFLAYFSFLGTWKIFETFINHYPHLYKKLALGILFIPSMIFWGGAGLMKDTVVLGFIGFLVFNFHQIFILKRPRFINFLSLFISTYCIFVIKLYVVLALLPMLFIWWITAWQQRLKNKPLRKLAKPILLCAGIISAIFVLNGISMMTDSRFNLDKILGYVQSFQAYSEYRTQEYDGSGYSFGEFDPSFKGIMVLIPKAFNVSFFRPYLWEAKKLILIPSALEALIALIFTLWVVLKAGIFGFIRKTFSDPLLLFSLGFSLLFATAIGLTAYNFGTLARYRVLCLPFYFAALIIILAESKRKIRVKSELN